MRRARRVVRHQHQAGVVLAVECQHQFEHGGRRLFVEVAGGFVAEHARRLVDQRTRHGGALALAAGEFARLVLQAMPRPTDSSNALRAASILHTGAVEQHRQHHVLQRGEFRQQVVELVDEAERAVAQLPRAASDKRSSSGRRRRLRRRWAYRARQQVQQRALACAGGAEDRDGLAFATDSAGHRTPACAACLRHRSCRASSASDQPRSLIAQRLRRAVRAARQAGYTLPGRPSPARPRDQHDIAALQSVGRPVM
jgi:hypothetical protein